MIMDAIEATVDVWRQVEGEWQKIADHPDATADQKIAGLTAVMTCRDVAQKLTTIKLTSYRAAPILRRFLQHAEEGSRIAAHELQKINAAATQKEDHDS